MTKGQRINLARKHLKFSFKRLGDYIDVSEAGVRAFIERNNVRDLYLDIFEKKLGISKNWIETGEGDMILQTVEPVHQETILRFHEMMKPHLPEDLLEVWELKRKEIIDLLEYKEAYIRAKEMRPKL